MYRRPFQIHENIYDVPQRMLLTCFTWQRCGSKKGWAGECHMDDGIIKETGEHKDFSGGYHQSCDLRKSLDGVAIGVIGMIKYALSEKPHWDDGIIAEEIKWACDYYMKVIHPDGYMHDGLFVLGCSHIEISNCDFSFIGGCYYPIQTFMQSPRPNPARMGNGVQLWCGNSDITVTNCCFNQIYDAGISPQGDGRSYSIRNLRFHHNFIKNCFYSFEFWGRPSTTTCDSVFFENNTCINANSWSNEQRPDNGGAAHLKLYRSDMAFSNVYIRNNIFFESVDFGLYSQQVSKGSNTDAMWKAFMLDYNCYYKSSKEKPVILWRGGAAGGGGDYFMGDLKAYQEKSGKELHTIFADPMLSPVSKLMSGSPAIDAGIDVGYPFNGSAPDMGAFEFNHGSK